MTSNYGSQLIQERFENLNEENKYRVYEETRAEVTQLLRKTIRPEFLNRVDETIMFLPLDKSDVKSIVRLQLNHVKERLGLQQVTIDATESAVAYLAEVGYDPQYGGRPVKRVIQKRILNQLSKEILAGKLSKDSVILIDTEDDRLVFRNQEIDIDQI
jgi:ATP-dependent Clp protease ATP-binding subunit ClpB